MTSIEARQKVEVEFWRNSEHESPGSNSIYNIINKLTDAEVFLDCLQRYRNEIAASGRVLELGGGQGWAACIYKRLFPDAEVLTSDISEFAVASVRKWERLFNVRIDGAYPCRSYETREDDASVDQVFCFASAHHFLAHKRTLHEISRILKPGAKAFYFAEPTTPRLLYWPAKWRVNRLRPEVPEDVLVTAEIRRLARLSRLDVEVDYYPSLIKRGALESVYYAALNRVPVLQYLLPCSANFAFTRLP